MSRPAVSTLNPTMHSDRSSAAFLSLNEAAAMLHCSRRFLEIRIEDGELKVFRPSKRLVRIKRSELDRWVESYSAKTGVLT
jgi:excisionase family DNA binding protein